MKNLIKYMSYFVIVCMAVGLFSCSDQLTKAPLDSPSDVTFFSNANELEVAINGVYNSLWWEIRNIPGPLELDNSTDIGFLRDGPLKIVAQGGHTTETSEIENTWNHFYAGIARANNLLENMDKAQEVVTEEFFARIQAEARFLRAFFYHYLTELYGDVPLILRVLPVAESQQGRTTKSEVVEQIYSDLDFAAQHLPIVWSGDDEGRATRGAALALKARVALYNENYGMVSQVASEVMNLGAYELYPDYEGQFQYEGVRSSGVILDVDYADGVNDHDVPIRQGDRMVGAWSTEVPSQFMLDSYQATDGRPIDQSTVYDPANPFENRDPRLEASIVRPQSTFAGYVFETHPDSTETWRIEAGVNVERVDNQNVLNPFASFTGLVWRKYLSEEDFPERAQSGILNFIYIRYAEVLLTYAEAKIESNDIDQSVLDAMNKVRARGYGVEVGQTNDYPVITTTDQNELRHEIRYERKVELANEGFRWFDIRRWGIADQVMDGPLIGHPPRRENVTEPPTIQEDLSYHPDYGALQDLYRNVEQRTFNSAKDWLWPIPQAEINVNENISQNPGY